MADGATARVLAAVAAGGVLGAEARYGIGVAWPHPPTAFPWPTLLVNSSGCLLIGVLMVVITERARTHPLVRPFLGVGVLGGYTTFSTFAVDVVTLARVGHPVAAGAYLVATPLAALVAVAAGVRGARAVLR